MEKYSDTALPRGTVLDSGVRSYKVECVLGRGGFGITYRVTTHVAVGNVKIKTNFCIKEHFLSDYSQRDSGSSTLTHSGPGRENVTRSENDFEAEAIRLNRIGSEHPNIVHVNEVFHANNTCYYVMEYLDGMSLRSFIEQHGPLDIENALKLLAPLFRAVAYLHSNSMTHLDIKPDNVMLVGPDENGVMRPVLIDFGLSKHYAPDGSPTSELRTLGCSAGYAPAEQYIGISQFTPQADVYALAATLCYTLTGKNPPIASELTSERLESYLPASLPDGARKAIAEALRMDKNQRTQSVDAFVGSLDQWMPLTTAHQSSPSGGDATVMIGAAGKPVKPRKPEKKPKAAAVPPPSGGGTELLGIRSDKKIAVPSPKKTANGMIWIIVGVAVAILGAGAFFMLRKPGAAGSDTGAQAYSAAVDSLMKLYVTDLPENDAENLNRLFEESGRSSHDSRVAPLLEKGYLQYIQLAGQSDIFTREECLEYLRSAMKYKTTPEAEELERELMAN